MHGTVDLVVVGGGDGTVNAAAPGLLDTGLPLGILPLGTANDLARTLGLPLDLEAAVGVVAGGRTRRIDLGEVNGHPYFNVASIGFGVDLTHALTSDAKRRWGPLGYAVAGLRVLRRLRPFHADIEVGGERHRTRTVHLAVGNGPHYGGGMTVSRDASICDGRLDVYSLEVESVWKLLMLLPALRSGRTANWTEIRTIQGREIRVATRRERSVNADGEIVTHTPAVFRVRHGAVEVCVPG
jgi:YegS/Rv2252/BmrU family lipid kinase